MTKMLPFDQAYSNRLGKFIKNLQDKKFNSTRDRDKLVVAFDNKLSLYIRVIGDTIHEGSKLNHTAKQTLRRKETLNKIIAERDNQAKRLIDFKKVKEALEIGIEAQIGDQCFMEGISLLRCRLPKVEGGSSVNCLFEMLVKENLKFNSIKRQQQSKIFNSERKNYLLLRDLKILTTEKEESRKLLIEKALLLVNAKKEKIKELSSVIELAEEENKKLKKEIEDLVLHTRKKGKRKLKRK